MTICKFYERDDQAYNDYIDWARHCAADNPQPYPEEEPDTMCAAFCKYYAQHNGFPGEILECCEHPNNRRILSADNAE